MTDESKNAARWCWAMKNVDRIAWWTDCGYDATALQEAVDEQMAIEAEREAPLHQAVKGD